jgi:hypothetical protein
VVVVVEVAVTGSFFCCATGLGEVIGVVVAGGFAGLHWNFDPDEFLYRFIS